MKHKVGDVVRVKSGRLYQIVQVRERGTQWRSNGYIARQICDGGHYGPHRAFKEDALLDEDAFEPVTEKEK